MDILDTASGRIKPNWSVEDGTDDRAPKGYRFSVVSPFNDGLPGQATLGFFAYRPHAELAARAPRIVAALDKLLDHCTSLVNSGDCGNWNPETEDEVIEARAALASLEDKSDDRA